MAAHSTAKVDECESIVERPPAKGASDSLGSKSVWKVGGMAPNRSPDPQDRVDKDRERLRGDVITNGILTDKVALLMVEDNDGEGSVSAVNGGAPVALTT